nr:MAG TPA: hypothetical protein [Bacteriophage sp.]
MAPSIQSDKSIARQRANICGFGTFSVFPARSVTTNRSHFSVTRVCPSANCALSQPGTSTNTAGVTSCVTFSG